MSEYCWCRMNGWRGKQCAKGRINCKVSLPVQPKDRLTTVVEIDITNKHIENIEAKLKIATDALRELISTATVYHEHFLESNGHSPKTGRDAVIEQAREALKQIEEAI